MQCCSLTLSSGDLQSNSKVVTMLQGSKQLACSLYWLGRSPQQSKTAASCPQLQTRHPHEA